MGTLGWTISRAESLVTVSGAGVYDLAFARALRATMWAEGTVGYGKLLDLSQADIRLSSEDLETMVANTVPASAMFAGPIAVVLAQDPDPLLLDMAILLKSRMGNRRRLRVFTDEAAARRWLSSEMEIADLPNRLSRLAHRAGMNGNFAG
jgi:hypothetical protein